jgi:hypothetical protein
MSFENRKYVIFSTNETSSIDFSDVLETEIGSLRLNASGSETFVKYDGDMPQSVIDLTTRRWKDSTSSEYTHTEIITLLRSGSDWARSHPDDDIE